MNKFKLILKYLSKNGGYPNKDMPKIFRYFNYHNLNFLPNMVETLGESGSDYFVDKSIRKIYTPNKGVRIDLKNEGYPDSYIYLIIKNFRIDLEESEEAILINYSWGEGMIMHPEENRLYTKEELYQDADMQEWSDMLDMFESASSEYFYNNFGFGLWFE